MKKFDLRKTLVLFAGVVVAGSLAFSSCKKDKETPAEAGTRLGKAYCECIKTQSDSLCTVKYEADVDKHATSLTFAVSYAAEVLNCAFEIE